MYHPAAAAAAVALVATPANLPADLASRSERQKTTCRSSAGEWKLATFSPIINLNILILSIHGMNLHLAEELPVAIVVNVDLLSPRQTRYSLDT